MRSISWYSSMVYCCNLATFGSPLTVCMPPAACQVDPDVSSARSISRTSFQPILVKWYKTLAPTTPPPITATWAWFFMGLASSLPCDHSLETAKWMLDAAADPLPNLSINHDRNSAIAVSPRASGWVIK